MIKNVIKTCCCFVDKAVWFVNQFQSAPLWQFDHVKRQTRIADILEEIFIKEIRTVRTYIDGQILVKNIVQLSFLALNVLSFNFFIYPLIQIPYLIT